MANNAKDKKILLKINDLKQYFPVKKTKLFQKEQLFVKANDGVSLDIYEGETIGLVGESGCGKSTFGRVLLQLYKQTAGQTMYYGRSLGEVAPAYVEDIYKNLSSYKKKYEELNTKGQKEDAETLLLEVTKLVGGLFLADDLEAVSKAYLDLFEAQKEAYHQQKGNNQDKVSSNKIEEALKHIETLKASCKKKEKFEAYEANLDDGIHLSKLEYNEMRLLRKDLQLIFQDPYSSLDPRMTVGQIIGEGLLAHNYFEKNDPKMQEYVLEVMEKCGLSPYMIHRYPHQFSGGQRQRIGIARSLALKPKFVVCDEAVSALDVSIQSQIINLLLDLKEKDNLTYLFISHDLSVVKYISDRIGVMYLGNLVELATTEELFEHPLHPYTEALLSAIPTTDATRKKEPIILEGDIPSPIKPPKGCKFHTRCRYATEKCRTEAPVWEEVRPGHFVACHHQVQS